MVHRHSVSLLVLLPTYDERANLAPLVTAIRGSTGGCRILVVDDASPDGTGEIAASLASGDSAQVEVLRHQHRVGLARSRHEAFSRALDHPECRHVVLMDSDFSHDPGRIPALVEALDEADVAVGSRCVPGGGEVGRGIFRRSLTRAANGLAAGLLRRCGVKDMTAGYFAFRREALARLLPHLDRCHGFASSMELKWVAAHLGLRMVEVPVLFRARRAGTSKLSFRILLEALYQVVAMACRRPVGLRSASPGKGPERHPRPRRVRPS